MQQKIYLSVLGTNDYLTCNYLHGDKEIANVRFVQEATIQMLCRGWSGKDRIVIFTTEKAYQSNWLDGGHTDKITGKPKQCMGLKQCISALGLSCKIDNRVIPDGRSEEEIWELFRIIEAEIPVEGEVFVDITHSFRSLPMLVMVALNYAKTTKRIRIGGIFYGALEVLGDITTVSMMPTEERLVPIFDLSAFDQLLDWAVGIDRFISSGDARFVGQLAQNSVKPILARTQGRDETAFKIQKMGSHLSAFTEVLSTCRGQKIKEVCGALKRDLSEYSPSEHATAFDPLIDRIKDHMSKFNGEHVSDGLQAVRWCLGHNLIQQRFTLLLETIITAVLLSIEADIMDRNARMAVTGAASVLQRGVPDKEKDLKDQFYVQSKMYLGKNIRLVDPITQLVSLRNDLNHAGWRNNAFKPQQFRTKLEHLIDTIEPILT